MLAPEFLKSGHHRIFCARFIPGDAGHSVGDVLLFLPPFAEEANKSRRMMARLGHALAGQGITTVIPDLLGTGDSEGELGEVTLSDWRQNIVDTAAWARPRRGGRLLIGGLRLGGTLAYSVLDLLPQPPSRLLLWQPVLDGSQQLQQFLRLRVAAGMCGEHGERASDLAARMAAGETLEIAGYDLNPSLAEGLKFLRLASSAPPSRVPCDWLELSRRNSGELSPPSARLVGAWQEAGCQVHAKALSGEAFWATQELVDVPELVSRSVALLGDRT